MPTYEYQCDKCSRVFEIRQRISEPMLTTCDACGGKVRRLLSAAPFILKGEGWYVTDYPSESRKKARASDKKARASEKSSAGGDGKSTEGQKTEKTEKTEKKDDGAAKTTTSAPAPASPASPPSSSSSASSD